MNNLNAIKLGRARNNFRTTQKDGTMDRRICYIGNAASIHTQRWINYFAGRGWHVSLITWHMPNENNIINKNIRIYRVFFPPHYIFRYGCLLEIALMLKNIKPDILHAHYLGHFGIIAGLYGKIFRFKPIVLSAWGSDILYDAKGFKKILIKLSMEIADLITCDGINSKEAMVKLGMSPSKIRIIYHGVDTDLFSPDKRDRKLIGDLFGNEDFPAVVCARALNSRGGIETFIKSIPIILSEFPDTKFLIIGDGVDKKRLMKLARFMGLCNSLKFLGYISHEDLPRFLASSDIYVSPSLLDGGVAVATLDAMSCSVAPIVTDVGDNKMWIKDAKNGFVVDINRPDLIADRVICLLKNGKMRDNFGSACRCAIIEKQDYYKNMEVMENLYLELMESGKLPIYFE